MVKPYMVVEHGEFRTTPSAQAFGECACAMVCVALRELLRNHPKTDLNWAMQCLFLFSALLQVHDKGWSGVRHYSGVARLGAVAGTGSRRTDPDRRHRGVNARSENKNQLGTNRVWWRSGRWNIRWTTVADSFRVTLSMGVGLETN